MYKYEALAQITVIFSNVRDFKYKGSGQNFLLTSGVYFITREENTKNLYRVSRKNNLRTKNLSLLPFNGNPAPSHHFQDIKIYIISYTGTIAHQHC
jgi:hypothetical protein